jgi:glycosyltransferase involved in cell wall biosynthesis
VQKSVGRLRYQPLVGRDDLDLTLLVPEVWREYGSAYRADPADGDLHVHIAPVRWSEGGPAKWYLHHYKALGKILKETQPDVIHLWEEPWSLVALQAMWLRDRLLPHAALVLETDQNIHRKLPFPFEWIRKLTLRKTDLLIARQAEAESTSRACGYQGPARFVGYGVDEEIFYPDPSAEARWDLGMDGFVIGYVGRLVREKGLFDILDAMSHCDTGVHIALMGSGADRDALAAHAKQLGIENRVRIIDPQPPAKVGAFMRSLDVLALMSRTLPTWKEQFGRVIIEAQACGTPVIGSSSGSIPEVVGEGGWIVPEGNPLALAELLMRLRNDADEVKQKAKLGVANVAKNYTYARVGEQLIDVYRTASVAPGRGKPMTLDKARGWGLDSGLLPDRLQRS